MKKLIIFTILILISTALSTAYSEKRIEIAPYHSLHCHKELEEPLSQIQKLPKANDLILQVLEEGPISIKVNRFLSKKFNGYWDGGHRNIYITRSKSTSEGALLSTLLFELHNASRNRDFEYLDNLAYHRKIKKKEYVKAVEHIEFENVQATTRLIKEGNKLGLFPRNCHWSFPNNFEEYLRDQKSCGHSAWIAKQYTQMCA